jgi:hypothetical protein
MMGFAEAHSTLRTFASNRLMATIFIPENNAWTGFND